MIDIAWIEETERWLGSPFSVVCGSRHRTMFQADKRTWESLGMRARGRSSPRSASHQPGACSRASARSNTAPMKR